ncbi:MAG TPA: hypothetical protein VFP95_00920 [Gammaproteobacteria bacterium]|nr:hypothetical protein [Gammaproteobacteria bacterium]
MHASPLRQLVRRYAAGNISREDYLLQRRALLNAFADGKAIDYHAHRPIVLIRGPRWLRPAIFGTTALIIVIVVGSLLWLSRTQPAAPLAVTSNQTAAETLGAGEQVLQQFLAQEDWSSTSLNDFKNDWLALSDFERESARRSLWHRRLLANTQQKLREIEALQAISPDPQLGLRENTLRDFLSFLIQRDQRGKQDGFPPTRG